MRCDICGSVMRETNEPIVEVVRGVRTSVSGIHHNLCDSCGNTSMLVSDATKLGKEQFRQVARELGLLTPDEIKAIRLRLGMTQSEFEAVLGVSKPTCSRWENGVMLPSSAADKLMRILSMFPEITEDAKRAFVTPRYKGQAVRIEYTRRPQPGMSVKRIGVAS